MSININISVMFGKSDWIVGTKNNVFVMFDNFQNLKQSTYAKQKNASDSQLSIEF